MVIADESKLVGKLGRRALAVEVLPFLVGDTRDRLERLGCWGSLRLVRGLPYVTDNGNWIIDLTFAGGIDHPDQLARASDRVLGVGEHGLFVDMAQGALIEGPSGVKVLGSLGG